MSWEGVLHEPSRRGTGDPGGATGEQLDGHSRRRPRPPGRVGRDGHREDVRRGRGWGRAMLLRSR